MNLKQALQNPEIRKKIYDHYPLTKKERQGCETEKSRMDGLRQEFLKRIIVTGKEKKEFK